MVDWPRLLHRLGLEHRGSKRLSTAQGKRRQGDGGAVKKNIIHDVFLHRSFYFVKTPAKALETAASMPPKARKNEE
jgi:hypothetical protein